MPHVRVTWGDRPLIWIVVDRWQSVSVGTLPRSYPGVELLAVVDVARVRECLPSRISPVSSSEIPAVGLCLPKTTSMKVVCHER